MPAHRRAEAARPARLRVLLILLPILATIVWTAHAGRPAAAPSTTVRLPFITSPEPLVATALGGSFNQVVAVADAGDDRLFIAQRDGVVKILHPDGDITTFLDISDRVTVDGAELGFFDLVFDPGYLDATALGYGQFYVTYSGYTSGAIVNYVARFRVSSDPDQADSSSEAWLVKLEQERPVHKGGGLDFDETNRLLYVGFGDDWRRDLAQSPDSLKGKIVMLDISGVPPEATGDATNLVTPVVWALGFRNPWRIDVDPESGAIFVGDVGENHWEEVNVVSLAGPGQNFGWPCLEAADILPGSETKPACADLSVFTPPVFAYAHSGGRCAIIGGDFARPAAFPDGHYLFGDMCSRDVWVMLRSGSVWSVIPWGVLETDELFASISADDNGISYTGTLSVSGPIWRIDFP